jgi:hypothetical protein
MSKIIDFNDSFYVLHQKDISNFFRMLYGEKKFQHKTIFVGNCYEEEKKRTLMKTVFVEFRVYATKHKPGDTGELFVWKTYREKSFSCASSGFWKINSNLDKVVSLTRI